MKQRINVAVEIIRGTAGRRKSYLGLLIGYALDNSFVGKNLSKLGSFYVEKGYFRFKYVEHRELTDEIKKTGFYYWTANDFKDTDVKILTLSQFADLLDTIEESDYKQQMPYVVGGRYLEFDNNRNKLTVGCKTFNKTVVRNFLEELLANGIQRVTLDFGLARTADSAMLTRADIMMIMDKIQRGE
jgi:hypothetical protein